MYIIDFFTFFYFSERIAVISVCVFSVLVYEDNTDTDTYKLTGS